MVAKEENRMKNPLFRRIPRELRHDLGKYAAIFLFLVIAVGFVSGFLVADGSMKRAYDESFEMYHIEDGHFSLAIPMEEGLRKQLEKQGVTVYELLYKERTVSDDHTLRIFQERTEVNQASLLAGKMPENEKEIAIDRLYAENNEISVGDNMETGGLSFRVCGFAALSDYSALFKNNTDMMFDAQKFSIALVTQETFDSLGDNGIHYCYAWRYNDKALKDDEKNEIAEELLKVLGASGYVTDFVKQADNQAIMFTGDDMGGDKAMITWLLYIVMVVLAFVFAVTANNTVEQESSVIGTLRASGYTKGELFRHYLTLPMVTFLIAAVIGNVLGYTVMKEIVVAMYYGSYSLPAYKTIWNAEAFFLTTVVSAVIMLVVNSYVLIRKLSLSPLRFLRRDLTRTKKSRAVRLPGFSFFTRFRLRVIFQNIPIYITLFTGILFASILLFFGMMMSPLLESFKTEVENSKFADYQYILKVPAETVHKSAEKYAVLSLKSADYEEELTVYGISPDSRYLTDLTLPENPDEIVISDGYMEKFGLSAGEKITLKDKYSDKEYTFTVADSYHYPASMAVFMAQDNFNTVFNKEEGYFTGYLSNEVLTDIDEAYIATVITEHDLCIVADQLDDSMGSVFPLFGGFSVAIYMLVIYLLSKVVLEKNASSISMVKILGYSDREAGRLYLSSTAFVAALSLVLSLPLSFLAIKGIYYAMMRSMSGWLTFYVAPWIYPGLLIIGGFSYGVISLLHIRKIKKISMEEALKNAE